MTFNNYVTINDNAGTSLKFKTVFRNWRPAPITPSSSRVVLSGDLDVTFGAATLKSWMGELVAPVTADGSGWGTIADLRTLLKKRQVFTFTDHDATAYSNTHILGPFIERSLMLKWDSAANVVYVTVKILSKVT
jgi:hypothetical protein